MSANLYLRFRDQAVRRGASPCFLRPGGEPVPYAELERQSGQMAHVLAQHGVRPGDRVAVQVEKSIPNVMLYLGALRAGAVYLPLNTAYKEAELAYFFGDAEPRVIVCAPEREQAIAKLPPVAGAAVLTLGADGRGSLTEQAANAAADFEPVVRAADDLAAILYTSGTTGRSKGAMITHANLASNMDVLADIWRITGDDVLLHALPIYHVHGLFTALNTCLAVGARMHWLPRFDPAEVIRLLPGSTLMMGVPTFYTRLLDQPDFTKDVCRTMRLFIAGSAPLLDETFRAFEQRTGHAILERYGMTETGMNTSNPYDGERRPGTVGLPLPGTELRVTGEDGRVVPDGETGMIEVRGPNVFKGYWRMPDKTAEEMRDDGFFVTGDLGRIIDRGYVQIVGRAKDLIISGGYNVYPKEVELVIDTLPGVKESAVFGVPHPDFGEAVAAAVVSEPGVAPPSEQQVVDAVKQELANFKVPKRVLFMPELPRNTMGKVEKNRLRDGHRDLFQAS